MKIRFLALAAATLSAASLLASCKESASPNAGSANSGASANASASPAANTSAQNNAPATPASAATPTETFRSYYEAVRRNDAETVKSLLSKASIASIEKQAAQRSKAFDALFKEVLEGMSKDAPAALPESRNEKIEGERASLEVKDEKAGAWTQLKFIREDGGWKLSFAGEDAR